ncbi:SprT family protein [Geomicrobium sp. JCM 19038]|uniref:SprT family protein n=1 Tax=Geomicrobium sp. JCM 19038 TaxID=1460635 RepID=UPI00045F18D9|nr:SprT family protein [Geomicrobium sp. JCM 19038]GAK09800.1 putative metallopeptidase [Geomicrobium sp. JCM 19038]
MTNEELQQWTERLSKDRFYKPFNHTITFNRRLRTTGGRYLLHTHNIEMNPKQLEHFGIEEFEKIILHELCHYHLHIEGKGYQHKDASFKQLLNQVGGSRYCNLVPGTYKPLVYKYFYQCVKCNQTYRRKRQMDVNRYVCGRCKGKLKKVNENR